LALMIFVSPRIFELQSLVSMPLERLGRNKARPAVLALVNIVLLIDNLVDSVCRMSCNEGRNGVWERRSEAVCPIDSEIRAKTEIFHAAADVRMISFPTRSCSSYRKNIR